MCRASGDAAGREQDHGAARGADSREHGLVRVAAAVDLLAVPADHEQAVIDRQPKPESDHEVEREDVELLDLVHAAQDEVRTAER